MVLCQSVLQGPSGLSHIHFGNIQQMVETFLRQLSKPDIATECLPLFLR